MNARGEIQLTLRDNNMFNKNVALTASALALVLSAAPASAFFIDDFESPQQRSIETNGSNMGLNNPTTVSAPAGSSYIWGERELDITLVRGATSNRREAELTVNGAGPSLGFISDSGVQANNNVVYSGGDLDLGHDFTENYVLDHIAIDVLDLDIQIAALSTVALNVRLTDLDGNRFTVGKDAQEVFASQGDSLFFNLEDYILGGVDITEVSEVRLQILAGSTARDGELDNFRVVDRIPVPGSLLLLLPALALVKRRKA
mgnify:CR=1 FL=1